MHRVFLLGVPLDAVTGREACDRFLQFLQQSGRHHITTPNSEMLVEARRNACFSNLLQRTALNLPDGVGLLWMARWTGQFLTERVTGVDMVERLCAELTEERPVFLLGGEEGIGGRVREVLCAKNPRLRVVGIYAGTPRASDAAGILQRINAAKPHLLLVAFGAPEQDLWIDRYLPQMPSVRVAMGIGGTLDFLAGVQKRAPLLIQRFGFEWLWRLLHEPRRFRRIWRAVVVFPCLVMRYGRGIPHSLP